MGSPKPALTTYHQSTLRPPLRDCFPVLNWYPQQSAWVCEPRASDSAAYNYPLPLRLQGRLEKQSLQQSLQEIVRRHEVLRSVFRMEEDGLVQIVNQPQPFSLAELDLSALNPHETESRIHELAFVDSSRPFDLAKDPLLRAALIQVAEDDHVLLLCTHHAVCDEWSAGIILRELSALYSAFVSGKASPLAPVSCSYGHFARRLSRRIEEGKLEPQFRFWMDTLSGAGNFNHLAPDHPYASMPSHSGAHTVSLYSVDLLESIKMLSARERVSPFMIYVAAFQLVLAHYSGENDIGVATCTANRNSTDLEQTIGPFSNRVILRTDFSGNISFRELFARVRKTALDAYSNQETPFGDLVKRIADSHSSNRNPLFQILLILRGEPADKWESHDLIVLPFPLNTGTTRYDLNVWLQPKDGIGLEVDLQYNTRRFLPETMRNIMDSYHSVLELMVKNPDARIHELQFARGGATAPALSADVPRDTLLRSEDQIEKQLLEIWEEIFGLHPLSLQSDFFALGGDSVGAVRLFARIEEKFHIKLSVSTLLETPTILDLARVLKRQRSQDSWSSLIAVQPAGIRPPVFCIHSHTGDVFYGRHLARFFSPSQPIYGIQSQALSGKPPHFSVEEMAAHYVREMQSAQQEGPYYLFGYSFGGMVAFEMALRLQALGQRVAFLGMFNTPAPGSLDGWPLGQFSYLRKRTRIELGKLRALDWKGKAAHLSRNVRNFTRMVMRSLKADSLRLGARVLRNGAAERLGSRILNLEHINIAAAKKYIPSERYPGAITFFLTPDVPYLYSVAPQVGWRPYVTEGVKITSVTAKNRTSLREEFALALNNQLDVCHKSQHQEML